MQKTKTRLYVEEPLGGGVELLVGGEAHHYLRNVMRCKAGEGVALFNGRDGEWRAEIVAVGKKEVRLVVGERVAGQSEPVPLTLFFAPVKQVPVEYMLQKATEMGVSCVAPIWVEHSSVRRFNERRVRANLVLAAQQCGIDYVPTILPPVKLAEAVGAFKGEIIFCDEGAGRKPALEVLASVSGGNVGILIGAEGGFSDRERGFLLGLSHIHQVSLGKRVLRADTAALAALSLWQAVLESRNETEKK